MAVVRKKIIKFGNGAGLSINAKCLFASEMKIGDVVDLECYPEKIVINKVK